MIVGLASLKYVRQAGNLAGVDTTVLRQNSFLEPSDFPLKAFTWLKWDSHIIEGTTLYFGFPGCWLVGKKICLPMQETWIQSLGWEEPLEKEITTHSSILTWEVPWTEEPGGL